MIGGNRTGGSKRPLVVMAILSLLALLHSYSGMRVLSLAAIDSLEGLSATLSDSPASPMTMTTAAAAQVTASVVAKRSIKEIFQSTKTDKEWKHHYDRYYEGWLAPFRSKQGLMMAEIGAEQGKSLMAWAEYFDQPRRIVGVAYGKSAKGVESLEGYAGVELSILRGDQSKKKTMDTLCGMGPFDIIIDDGSHVPKHVIFSFFSLFKNCLNPGGIFVIEDLETNYWDVKYGIYGYKMEGTGFGTSPTDNAVEKLKQFIDILARYQLQSPDLSIMDGDEAICSIEFGMNIVVVKKCTEEAMRVRTDVAETEIRVVDVETRDKFVAEAKKTNPSIK